MFLEKAKPEEFEEYYAIKCEDFNLYWTAGSFAQPPRENLQRFYDRCMYIFSELVQTTWLQSDILIEKLNIEGFMEEIWLDWEQKTH